ncbi:MAG: hypothetical protein QW689_06155 [Nitrososphaerota archaeon]
MNVGLLITIAIYAAMVLTALFGGVFIHLISGRQAKIHEVGKKALRTFFIWALPPWGTALKALLVIALLISGMAIMVSGLKFHTYQVETGRNYWLVENSELRSVVGDVPYRGTLHYWVYRYALESSPIYTTIVEHWIEPGAFIIGLTLFIAAFYAMAIFLVRANNALYKQQEATK